MLNKDLTFLSTFGHDQLLEFETNLSIVPSISSVNRIPVTAPRMGNLSTVSSPKINKNKIKKKVYSEH